MHHRDALLFFANLKEVDNLLLVVCHVFFNETTEVH